MFGENVCVVCVCVCVVVVEHIEIIVDDGSVDEIQVGGSVRVIRPPAPPARTRYPPAALLFVLLPVT